MNILVTGGAGFIASHIIDKLIKENYNVVVIDNLSSGKINNLNPKAVFYNLDICSSEIEEIFKKHNINIIIHHAAQINVRKSLKYPYNDAKVNILGSLNLCSYALKYKIKQFIFASTASMYGNFTELAKYENSNIIPSNPYALSKYVVEQYLILYSKLFSINYTILRYSNVYGPRQNYESEAGVIAIFSDKIIKNENPTIYGDGNQKRDFIFIDNIVDCNIQAVKNSIYGIFNIASEVETSINTILNIILTLSTNKVRATYKDEIEGEPKRILLNNSLMKKNFKTNIIDIKTGIKNTFKWLEENYKN